MHYCVEKTEPQKSNKTRVFRTAGTIRSSGTTCQKYTLFVVFTLQELVYFFVCSNFNCCRRFPSLPFCSFNQNLCLHNMAVITKPFIPWINQVKLSKLFKHMGWMGSIIAFRINFFHSFNSNQLWIAVSSSQQSHGSLEPYCRSVLCTGSEFKFQKFFQHNHIVDESGITSNYVDSQSF